MHRTGVILSNDDGEIEIKSSNGFIEINQSNHTICISDASDIDVFIEELLSIAENIKGTSNND